MNIWKYSVNSGGASGKIFSTADLFFQQSLEMPYLLTILFKESYSKVLPSCYRGKTTYPSAQKQGEIGINYNSVQEMAFMFLF
jgi:hypothetical protein